MKDKKIKICFDIDGVICSVNKKDYKFSSPIKKNINYINKLYREYFIIFFTARHMGRNNDNKKLAMQGAKKLTLFQLNKWGVKYDKIYFGKPSYDIFIDDKSLFYKKNWINTLKLKLRSQKV
jgi:hypothetical protein